MHTEAGKFKSIVGDPFYVAPEVLAGLYDYRCDIWSIGVMFYFMLTKTNPFYSGQEHKIYEYILKKEIKYTGAEWKGVPDEAKDLCMQLLQRDPNERLSLANAINHPYFVNVDQGKSPSRELGLDFNIKKIITNIKSFRSGKRFQKEVIKIMVMFLSDAEIKHIRDVFRLVDHDHDGVIGFEELRDFLKDHNEYEGDEEIYQ